MSIQELLTEKVLSILAIDLGLVILLMWFLILLLIIREFRKFAQKFSQPTSGADGLDPATLQLCQQSVDNALNYTSENGDTLNDLIQIQKALEQQVAIIQKSTGGNISPEDQASIDELNKKLNKSHKLIRKLKGDLDKSVKGLKMTRKKLFDQNDTVESLREEKAAVEKEFEKLEEEYIQISKAGGFYEMAQGYQAEKKELLETIEQYKELADQGGGNSEELESMQQELQNTLLQLEHMTKEKEFVEKRYLDLVDGAKD